MKRIIILWEDGNEDEHFEVFEESGEADSIKETIKNLIKSGEKPQVYIGELCSVVTTVEITKPTSGEIVEDTVQKIKEKAVRITCPACDSEEWNEDDDEEEDNERRYCPNCGFNWKVKDQDLINDADLFITNEYKCCLPSDQEPTTDSLKCFLNGFLSDGKKRKTFKKVSKGTSLFNRGVDAREEWNDEPDDEDEL